jgi:hypothetical protein
VFVGRLVLGLRFVQRLGVVLVAGDVPPHVAHLLEALSANIALIRPLVRMRSNVRVQVVLPRERLSTRQAQKVLDLIVHVPLVNLQFFLRSESLAANLAAERRLVGVNALVRLQQHFGDERLAAVLAAERLHGHVHAQVDLQVVLALEALAASGALVVARVRVGRGRMLVSLHVVGVVQLRVVVLEAHVALKRRHLGVGEARLIGLLLGGRVLVVVLGRLAARLERQRARVAPVIPLAAVHRVLVRVQVAPVLERLVALDVRAFVLTLHAVHLRVDLQRRLVVEHLAAVLAHYSLYP